MTSLFLLYISFISLIHSQSRFTDESGSCQFCHISAGRPESCKDSSSWDDFGTTLTSYCSLSCELSEATYDSSSDCDCNAFSCSTPTTLSPEDCIIDNCDNTPNITYCDNEGYEYDSYCAAECYGLSGDDVFDCDLESTQEPISETTKICECDDEYAPVCCTDGDADHYGTYSNQCEAGKLLQKY